MNANIIRRGALPLSVYTEGHRRYPKAVGQARLYAAAFFGHSHPHTQRTCKSVWRGLLRAILLEQTQ